MKCVRLSVTSRAKSSCTPCASMWKRAVRQRWWLLEVKSFCTFVRCPLLLFWLSVAQQWKTTASHRASSQKSVCHTCRHTTRMCVSCGLVSYCFLAFFVCLKQHVCTHERDGGLRRSNYEAWTHSELNWALKRKLRKTSLCWVALNRILMRPWKNINQRNIL